jgi:glycosyltransferase involved in cell wall biosynthesis
MSETVAIITRTKNRPRLLVRCIRSVLHQTFRDWLHVIVNDGGDAKEVDNIIYQFEAEYGNRFKIIHHEQSRGMEAASNSGLHAISSEYVAFLDDDDTWHRDFLARMIRTLTEAQGALVRSAICQTEVIREKISGNDIVELGREPFNPYFVCLRLDDLLIKNQFTNNAMVFRRSVVDEIGYFNEKLNALGDWDFNLRLHLRYDAVVLDQVLARWHRRVQNSENPYENSIHTARDLHKMARVQLLNDAIRGCWLDEKPHLSTIMVLGRKLDELRLEQDRILHSSMWRLIYTDIRKGIGLILRRR